MASDLRARLEQHEKNFEGLMSLIPADLYYGKDNSDQQWNRKKQTKEEKRAAKKAKLVPGATKSALDVHRENELKRKRDNDGEDAVQEETKPITQQDEVATDGKPSKKRKLAESTQTEEEKRRAKAAKRKEKREQKQAKAARKQEKKKAKKAKQQLDGGLSSQKVDSMDLDNEDGAAGSEEREDQEDDSAAPETMDRIDTDGLVDHAAQEDEAEWSDATSSASTPDHDSPTFEEQSAASSSSSIQPPTEPEQKPDLSKINTDAKQPKLAVDTSYSQPKPNPEPELSESKTDQNQTEQDAVLPKINHQSLVSRLESKIAAMRAARQADGLNGKSARTRTELIEARRIKEAKRKQAKKDARAKQRADDAASNAVEEEAARLRGGEGSPLWSIPGLPSGSLNENFSFGTMRFEDGATTNADASDLRNAKKRKGPTDAKTQLSSLERKDARLAGLDSEKRSDIASKDAWLNARRRIAGEKVKDSSSMLRKTLKRNEKLKSKSEKEWGDRISGVQAAKEAKQQRREDNLAKRRDEKNAPRGGKKSSAPAKGGAKGKDRWGIKMNKGKAAGPAKAKKRPGFEGTFKIGGGRR